MLRDLFSLFPAYAGVIPNMTTRNKVAFTFPRIRGGDPYTVTDADGDTLFSPHTRG